MAAECNLHGKFEARKSYQLSAISIRHELSTIRDELTADS
jgi:hypothetical protein